MIIFYTSPKSAGKYMQSVFDTIIETILSHGHQVLSMEVQRYEDLLDMDKAKKKEHKLTIHSQYVRKAIELSDAAIFEGSQYSFKIGTEVQMALDKKVPVLMLANNRDYSEKVQDPYFYSAVHKNDDDIRNKIEKFFETVKSKHLNKRVNVFLHNKHLNYLDWYVHTHEGTNRSEAIRDVLENEIDRDEKYKKR